MPFMIVHSEERGYCVFTQDESGDPKGDTHGCHPTREKAVAQMRALYANVPDARKSEEKSESAVLVAAGGALKSLGDGKIGGYLVTFGDESTPDLSEHKDFFDADTDFAVDAWPIKSATYYRHGLDPTLDIRRLPSSTLEKKDAGVWFEVQLNLADEYEAKVYKLAQVGKLRLSSGSLNHLVRRQPIKTATGETVNRVTHWPLGGDSSVAPDPCDPRNIVTAIKSLPPMPTLDELAATVADVPTTSLAENTEQWLDRGEDLLGRYRCLGQAEVKAGRAISAARMQRLQQAHSLIGQIIEECQMPEPQDTGDAETPGEEASPAEATETMAPGMGSPDTLTALRKRDQISTRGRAALTLYGS